MTSFLTWPESWMAGPRTWAGSRRVLGTLTGLAARDALPHTLMLVGRRGLGREALAIDLAASLLCRSGGAPGCPCGACDRVRRGVHPDLAVIDVLPDKKEIVVEQARDLADGILQRPYEGRRRVYVLASANTPPLNVAAASALLKTLEEPPGHATLLLLCANPARALATIVSRSVQVRVPPPTRQELLALLSSLHGLAPERAAELLEAAGDDGELAAGAAAEGLTELAASLRALLDGLLGGDVLALLRLAGLLRADERGLPLAVAAVLGASQRLPPEACERLLGAAASLLHAERRTAELHADLEPAVIGMLAATVASGLATLE